MKTGCQAKMGLYGLKRAPRGWNKKLNKVMKNFNSDKIVLCTLHILRTIRGLLSRYMLIISCTIEWFKGILCRYGQVLLQIRNLGEEKVKERKETNWKLCRYGQVIPAYEKNSAKNKFVEPRLGR